jgi:SAM-dependent methyltransferase
MSGYGVFAEYYDILTENVAYKKRADYFRTLLSAQGITGGVLLDLACGTGGLLFEMAAFGFDVIGVDASAEMLCAAQSKPEAADIKPLLLCQTMQALDLYDTVDAAVCALDSINHLTDPEDVKKTFQRVSLFLNPGGVFIFDVNTVYKHTGILANNTFVYDLDELYCVWQNRLDAKTDTVEITLDFFEEDDGAYFRSTETIAERAYPLDDLKVWLRDAGLTVTGVYEELTRSPVKNDTQRAVFVAVKGK